MIEYKNVSLANQVFEKIEYNILRGEYSIGEIISEKRLADELGVSRTPVREALRRLMEEDLVADSPNGTTVLGITEQDVDDAYEVKRRIEVPAAKMAAENIDAEGAKKLIDIVEQQEFYAYKGDKEKLSNLDTQFHDTIYSYCGSRVLEGILKPLNHKIVKFRQASLEYNEDRVALSIAEHRVVAEAIMAKNPEKAEAAMIQHVDNAHHGVIRDRKHK